MATILFTTPELGHPPAGGPRLRIENSIKALSRIADLILVSRVPCQRMGGDSAVSFYQDYCKKVLFLTNSDAEYCARNLIEISNAEHVDIIWLGYGNISYEILHYLKLLKCIKPIVVDTDSVWSRFVLRGLPYKTNLQESFNTFVGGWLKRWEEYWGTMVANTTTAVSAFDADYYKIFTQRDSSIKVFSNVIDLDSYKDIPDNPNIKKPCIYLAGSFGPSSPMEEAALWMIEKVLPLVKKVLLDVHFYIVGHGATEEMRRKAPENVTVTGGVYSVLPYLCHADVAVVPLKYESGTRFKILEAAACHIPLVSTTLGAEGIPVTNRHDIIIADTPEDFANAIIEVVKTPELGKMLSENCYELVSEDYSILTASKQAEDILQSIEVVADKDFRYPNEQISKLSQLAYKAYKGGNAENILSTSLGLFKYLMERFGDDPCFIEADEIEETVMFLKKAALAFPNNSLVVESLSLLKTSGGKKPAMGVEVLLKKRAQDVFSEVAKFIETNEMTSALAKCDEAMYIDPKFPNLQRFRAICLAALQRKREAVFAACAELSTQPDDHLMLEIIVSNLDIPIEEIKRSPTQTLALLDRIIRYVGDRISGLEYLRSLCLIVLSRLSEAVRALEQALSKSPQNGSMKTLLEKTTLALQYDSHTR